MRGRVDEVEEVTRTQLCSILWARAKTWASKPSKIGLQESSEQRGKGSNWMLDRPRSSTVRSDGWPLNFDAAHLSRGS